MLSKLTFSLALVLMLAVGLAFVAIPAVAQTDDGVDPIDTGDFGLVGRTAIPGGVAPIADIIAARDPVPVPALTIAPCKYCAR